MRINRTVVSLIFLSLSSVARAETGVEKCLRLNQTLGLDIKACEDAIVGSNPNSRDANDILEEQFRRQLREHSSDH